MTLKFNEKREMERFSLKLSTKVSMIDEGGKPRSFAAMTRNICAGGAFLKIAQPLPVETDVKINLILPMDNFRKLGGRSSHIDISGSVIRTESEGMAICFNKKYHIEAF